jgi:hypothetical protein
VSLCGTSLIRTDVSSGGPEHPPYVGGTTSSEKTKTTGNGETKIVFVN